MSEFNGSQEERRPTVCLLGASFGTENRGVAALAAGAITAALHAFPNGRIFLLEYNRTPSRHQVCHLTGVAEVELVNLRYSKRVLLPNNIARLLMAACWYRLLPAQRLKKRFLSRNAVLRRIMEADLIGSIAGGDSFSDIYGFGRLLYVSLPQLLVILLGKPLVLLPQTLGPFKGFFAKRVGRFILRRAKVVYARDRESLKEVGPLVGTRTNGFRCTYDMAFALEPVPPSSERLKAFRKLDDCRPLVGLNISGLLYMGGYTRDNMFGLKSDYRQLVRNLVQHFVKQGVHVLLVPHVFGNGPGSESDVVAGTEIHRELASQSNGRLHLLEGTYDHHEIKFVIGRCDFFVGSRMHACIAALSQCVPTIGLAYSRKFDGVLGSVGGDGLVIHLSDFDCAEVVRRIDGIYHRRAEIKQRLERRMPEVKATVLDLFSCLPETSKPT